MLRNSASFPPASSVSSFGTSCFESACSWHVRPNRILSFHFAKMVRAEAGHPIDCAEIPFLHRHLDPCAEFTHHYERFAALSSIIFCRQSPRTFRVLVVPVTENLERLLQHAANGNARYKRAPCDQYPGISRRPRAAAAHQFSAALDSANSGTMLGTAAAPTENGSWSVRWNCANKELNRSAMIDRSVQVRSQAPTCQHKVEVEEAATLKPQRRVTGTIRFLNARSA